MPDTTKRIAVYARTAAIQESGPNFAMDEQVRQCAEFALRAGFEVVQDQIYQEKELILIRTKANKSISK